MTSESSSGLRPAGSFAPGRVGGIWVLAASTLWGTSGVAAALIPQVNPLAIGALTLSLSGIVLSATSWRGLMTVFRAQGAIPLLVIASSSLALFILSFFSGIALAGVAIGTVVAIVSAPVFVGAVESITERRRPSVRWLVAATLALTGGALLVTGRPTAGAASDGLEMVIGASLAALAGLTYATFTLASTRLIQPSSCRPTGLSGRSVISAVHGLTILPLTIVAVVVGFPSPTDAGEWIVLLYIGLIPTAIGYLLYAQGLRQVTASTAALLTLFEPIVATMLGVFLIGEELSPLGWIGGAIAVAGLAVATVRE